MRLINADKLQAKHYLQRSEHPTGYEGTQAVYDYKDVLAYDIESAETVEAIPIEWLQKKLIEYIYMGKYSSDMTPIVYALVADWRKENE